MLVALRKSKENPDSGYTLVEIIIAIVIMGLVATSLLTGVQSGIANSSKIVVKQEPFLALASAAEIVAQADFQTCDSSNPNPYANSVTLPQLEGITVQITAVSGLKRNGEWKPCGSIDWGERASLMQLVEISATYDNGATEITQKRVVSKLFSASFAEYGGAGSFRVVPFADTVELVSTNSVAVDVLVNGFPETSQASDIELYSLPGSSNQININSITQKTNSSGAAIPGRFTMTISSGFGTITEVKKATLEIGAYDKRESKYSLPATLTITVLPPYSLASTNLSTQIGATSFWVGTLPAGAPASSVQLSASGGDGTAVSYSSSTSGVALSSTGLLTISNSSAWTSPTRTVQVTVKPQSNPSSAGQTIDLSIRVFSPLTLLQSSLSPTSTCTETATNILDNRGRVTGTNYDNTCTFSIRTTSGTGLGDTSANKVTFALTRASATVAGDFSTVTPTVSWVSASTNWQTQNFTFKYRLSKSTTKAGVCQAIATGQPATAATIQWTDPLLGAATSLRGSMSVTC